MSVYVDSSVVLRVAFGEPQPLSEWNTIERFIGSALLVVECFRAIDRLRIHGRFSGESIAHRYSKIREEIANINLVEVMPEIIERAAQPFPVA